MQDKSIEFQFSACPCCSLKHAGHVLFSSQEQRLMSHLLTLLAPNKRLPPPPPPHQPQHRTVEADGDKPLIEVVDDL